MSTEGCVVCCIRLCGARGFSNDKSLMYCALTISCCGPSGIAGGMSLWPLPLASSAITASPRPETAGLTRIGKAHQRSVPALARARHKEQLGLEFGLLMADQNHSDFPRF